MKPTVIIDCLPESASRYSATFAVVAVDVIRATTMAVTAAAAGRRCFPVATPDAAFALRKRFPHALLAGEQGGEMPPGFEINNSPALLSARFDVTRPLVLLSSSGTRLIANCSGASATHVACFRNSLATAHHLIDSRYPNVAILGAGSLGEFREEDQICCAWIASMLVEAGYVPGNPRTQEVLRDWGRAQASDCLVSRSVDYLRRTGQAYDLDFILSHINDLPVACVVRNQEVHVLAERHVTVAEYAPATQAC